MLKTSRYLKPKKQADIWILKTSMYAKNKQIKISALMIAFNNH